MVEIVCISTRPTLRRKQYRYAICVPTIPYLYSPNRCEVVVMLRPFASVQLSFFFFLIEPLHLKPIFRNSRNVYNNS